MIFPFCDDVGNVIISLGDKLAFFSFGKLSISQASKQ
jgi:hypothetical protein